MTHSGRELNLAFDTEIFFFFGTQRENWFLGYVLILCKVMATAEFTEYLVYANLCFKVIPFREILPKDVQVLTYTIANEALTIQTRHET